MSLHTTAKVGETVMFGAKPKRIKIAARCVDGERWSGDLYCEPCREIISCAPTHPEAPSRSREIAGSMAERHVGQRLFSKHRFAWFCSCHGLEEPPFRIGPAVDKPAEKA